MSSGRALHPPAVRSSSTPFGDAALALAPRALPVVDPMRPGVAAGTPEVAIAVDPANLDEQRREQWARPTGARWTTGGTDSVTAAVWTAPRGALAELDPLDEHDALLLEAQAGLDRPPARPQLMGVLNVTPDSFSDGGLHASTEAAVARGRELVAEGADLIDVGGESTRPGAEPVDLGTELDRVLPVVEALARELPVPISIDTRKAEVAARAVEAGASWVNDVSAGLHDPGMLAAVAGLGVSYVAMHAQGDPRTMQADPRYSDPVAEVTEALRARGRAALDAGIPLERLWLDPGIGFGKRLSHNLGLLRRLPELRSLGRPLVLGVSRKSFIGHITGAEEQRDWLARRRVDDPSDRVGGTAAALFACVAGGADVLRVHDVRIMAEAAAVARAVLGRTDPA